ncbi:hypothetical protein [Streptomyces sp. NPDC051665]|uniref:hypothetical protein n=1 Tax=Streptomyces sp. NPDC051665 TaxID=3154647 RepID=UPI0034420F79
MTKVTRRVPVELAGFTELFRLLDAGHLRLFVSRTASTGDFVSRLTGDDLKVVGQYVTVSPDG